MEYVVFSDIHMYKNVSRSYFREDGITSWTRNQIQVLNQIFDYVHDNNIGLVICNGDIFHEKNHIPQDLYNLVWNYFKERSKITEIIFNTGNHDYHNKELSSSLRPFSDIVRVVIYPQYITKNFYMIPHGKVLDMVEIPHADVLFTHEDIQGMNYGQNDYTSQSPLKQDLFKDFKLVINGHIHTPQTFHNILNIGSCMKHDFGDFGDRYFYHLNNDKIVKQIKVTCPDFISINGLSTRIKNTILNNKYDYFRIDISPEELSDEVFKQYNIFPNTIKQNTIKENRLGNAITIEDEIKKYIELSKTKLNKDKLLEIGKELVI